MYGGYGNIWNQAATQWPAANVPNQNQMPMQSQQAQNFQQAQQQQNMMGFGGNLANLSNAAGMMGAWGMNVGTAQANPFMNYGGNAAAFGMQAANSNPAATWLTNQHYQLQQSFPGGRPPLPPGPPPPDPPKETQMNQFGSQSQPPPPPPSSSLLGFPAANQQRAPPPPPPPPPPQPASQQSSALLPGTTINIEDALNIIKNSSALANLQSGPLIPTSLNVSEELFGSKISNKGIPGLDFTEEEKPPTPGPEVVDLEKEVENFDKEIAAMKTSSSSNNTAENKSNNSLKEQPSKIDNKVTENKSVSSSNSDKIVWELRTDAKTQEWTRAEPNSSGGPRSGNNNGWVMEERKSEAAGKDGKMSNTKDAAGNSTSNLEFDNKDNPDSKNRVRIPLESADGKELVYDRKILKQFDQKFREWENQFEDWKRMNQNHPNQEKYKQFLDQWNFWREQLIEQRRSILDKMMKAKLDCKDILIAKFESLDSGDIGSEHGSVETSSITSQPKDTAAPNKDGVGSKLGDKKGENPFETALRRNDDGGRPAPKAPLISSFPDKQEKTSTLGIPPLIPGLGDKNSDKSRPVERILRDGGKGSRGDRNMFEGDFNQGPPDKNPFMMNSTTPQSRFDRNKFNDRGNDEQNKGSFDSESIANEKLPFEWTLPSQNKEDKNPFDMAPQSNNPFMRPSGPNPFDMKPEQRLPRLDDFMKQENSWDFQSSPGPTKQVEPVNPFIRPSNNSAGSQMSTSRQEPQFERIPRDPQQTSTSNANTPSKNMRLEANPVGMPLLIAAKENPPEPRHNENEFSHLFSRDRGPQPAYEGNDNSNFDMDDDFVEDAEVIDYGAGGNSNSMDDMDFPRGENPDANNNDDDDPDFSLEDTEVIDYSQGIPPQEAGHYPGGESFGGYPNEFEHEDNTPWYGPGGRGRGRGFMPHGGRGHPRGPHPGHLAFGRGGPPPHFPPDYSAPRGRGAPRGMGRGLRGAAPPQEWFQHDDRESEPVLYRGPPPPLDDPEIVELSPPSETAVHPGIKIAPPNPEFERHERRRSRSRERVTRDRSRSRSRERVSRRSREEFDRRGDDSPYGSRRDRDRDRRSSPVDRRSRYDERRDRDRYRDKDRKGRSKSRSPVDDRNPVVRNPLSCMVIFNNTDDPARSGRRVLASKKEEITRVARISM